MKNKICTGLKCLLCLLCLLCLCACKSAPRKTEISSLTFFIVDENDLAVPDFEISLMNNVKGHLVIKESSRTNQTGFCTFYEIPASGYFVCGEKNGFTKIAPTTLNVQNTCELICFRVLSADYVLDKAEELYQKGQSQKALELIQHLSLSRQDKNQDPYRSDLYQGGVQ